MQDKELGHLNLNQNLTIELIIFSVRYLHSFFTSTKFSFEKTQRLHLRSNHRQKLR